jgi:hypothetical protein
MITKITPGDVKYCRFLRAKNPYGRLEGGENPWLLLDDPNTICWCLQSSGRVGPDNGLIAPERCLPGRKCYEPPRELISFNDDDK